MLSLPSTMAPAARRRRTTVASSAATWSLRMSDPPVVRTPRASKRSLSAMGTPCSGASGPPAVTAVSAARAASRAASPHTVMYARRLSRRAMRSRCSRTTSTGEIALVAIMRARSLIDVKARSATSDRRIARGGLHTVEGQRLERGQQRARAFHGGQHCLQLGVGPVEAGETRGATQRGQVVRRVHAAEHRAVACSWQGTFVIRRRVFWLTLIAALALAIVVAGAVGIYFLPQVVRQVAITAIGAATNRKVAIDAVDVDVSTGRFTVRGFRLADRDVPEPLATFDRLEGRLHRRSLLRLHIWFEHLTLVNPTVRIVRTGPGTFNISDLFGGKGSKPLDITIDHFVISGGTAVLDDRVIAPARTWRSENITVDARNVATLREGGTATASTIVQGAPVTVSVEDLRLYPIHLRAQVTLGVADLSLLRLYLPPASPVALQHGLVTAGISLVHDAREGTRLSMGARITGVVLTRRGQDVPFFTSPELSVTVNDLVMKAGGVALGRAEVDGDATVVDGGVAPPAQFHLTRLRFAAADVTWPATRPGHVSLAATLGGGGALDVTGSVRTAPRSAHLNVRLTSVPFTPFARYLPLTGHIDGLATADVAIVATFDAPFAIRATGTATLQGVTLEDDTRTDADRPRLAVARTTATGLEYEWPARAKVGRLHVVKPVVVLERDAQGEFPLRGLFTRRVPPPTSGGAPPPESRAPTDVVISELVVEGAAITAIDRTVSPAHRVSLAGTNLSVRDASWPSRGPATVRLSTPLPGGGDLLAEGTVKLDPQEGQLRVNVRGADVAQAQPYLPIAARVKGTAGADVTVEGTLTPLRLSVRGDATLSDMAVADGDRPLLGAEHAEARGIDLQWPGRLAIDRLRVRKPRTVVERDQQGVLSLQTLLTRRVAGAAVPTPGAA